MSRIQLGFISVFVLTTVLFSCITKKKKNETTGFGKFYHNTTAYYNGYWNAKELLAENLKTLRTANVDDYNKILEVEDYISVDNPKMVKADMDKIIEKVSTVAQLHEPSEWVDDCYVMMGKAQYLKQEYETAEETLEYFQEDFNPGNPYGRNYKSKKLTGKAAKKAKEQEKNEKKELKEKELRAQNAAKEAKAKSREEERKEKEKAKVKAKKEKQKNTKAAKKNPKSKINNTQKQPSESPVKEPISTVKDKTVTSANKTTAKEESFVPEKPKKQEEDKTAYSEGMLWLAKVYIKRENWFASQMLLEKLESSVVSDDIKSDLPATFANLYIKQKKYNEALVKLAIAINSADDRQQKARYAFIAGQISQILNQNDDALKYFAQAKKYAKDPKMEFMSDLAVAKNGIITGSKSKDNVIADLKKMLGDDKNAGLKDQIYFTLAEIEMSQDNTASAIDYFKNAVAYSISDQKLKTESYFQIANLFYNKERYLEASNYYDSTFALLQRADSRYTQVQKYVNNLKDIASNIEIIQYQDTLLYFASLSEDEQKKTIPKWLEKNKKQPEIQQSGSLFTKQIGVTQGVDFGNSTFFAYNRNTKTKGKEDFDKLWGRRPLEDDWRRISKSSGASSDNKNENKVAESDGIQVKYNKEEYDKFIRELPLNPVKKQEANDKIMTAMFTLGKLFRDKIENFKKSAETLENMHLRYGPTPYEIDSYFYLYLDYIDLGQPGKAQDYKDKIIKKYPDSKYTAILSDPNYFNKADVAGNKAEKYYKSIYQLYEKRDFSRALDAINQAPSVIGEDHTFGAKLALLKAMCIGGKEGKDAYVNALNGVISSYPNTPEQIKAREIMRFLGGDKSAFANVQDVDKIFERDENATHYVAVVTYALEENRQINFKVAISEYNKKNFKNERLQLGDASLNISDNSQIILIRKFDNEAKSLDYYKKVVKDADEFTGNDNFTYDVLAISQANYRKMLTERSAANYRAFFENTILKIRDK